MHPYFHEQTVPRMLDEDLRDAALRRAVPRRRLARRTGAGLVAVGTLLAATGRRLQEPAPGAACATCATC